MPFLPKDEVDLSRDLFAASLGRTNLSDVNENDQWGQFVLGIAGVLAGFYNAGASLRSLQSIKQATGDDLKERVKEFPFNALLPIDARRAIGKVRVSRPGTSGVNTAAAGTVAKRKLDNITYTLLQDATIPNGATYSNQVIAVCTVPGLIGNASLGALSGFSTPVVGVNGIENTTPFFRGRDAETDDELKSRFFRFIGALTVGTEQALESAVIGLEDPTTGTQVLSAKCVPNPSIRGHAILYVDDGAGLPSSIGSLITETLVNSAVGGELFLQSTYFPISSLYPPTLTRTLPTSLVLELGTDFTVNPTSGLFFLKNGGAVAGEQYETSYYPYQGLVPVVQRVVDGVISNRGAFPGVRGAGLICEVRGSLAKPISLVATVRVTSTVEDAEQVLLEVQGLLIDAINSSGVGASAVNGVNAIVRSELIRVAKQVAGVSDFHLEYLSGADPISGNVPIQFFERATTDNTLVQLSLEG